MPIIPALARMWISVILMLIQIGFFISSYYEGSSWHSKYLMLCIGVLWMVYLVSAGVRDRKANERKEKMR